MLAWKGGWRQFGVFCLIMLAAVLSSRGHRAWAAEPVDAGYRDFSFGTTCNSTPSGEKPESKLWFNDGLWWGSLCNGSDGKYHIYRLDMLTQDWIDTNTILDDRSGSKADVLWDGQKLYVASHIFTESAASSTASSQWGRLYRFSYNSGNKSYSLDLGFPVDITRGKSETITLDKDSTGKLWVTYVEKNNLGGTSNFKVMINHSLTGDNDWGVPYALPVTGATALNSDDISSLISFSSRIGVMWSNQATKIMYFATHDDTDPNDQNWAVTNAYNPGGAGADDHINLKSLQADTAGRVFAVAKTGFDKIDMPQINLLVCNSDPCVSAGNWQTYEVYRGQDGDTRPILLIDQGQRKLYVFTTDTGAGGAIHYKVSDLDNIQFPLGNGQVFIKNTILDGGDPKLNNPSSTKQTVSSATGIVVIASGQDTHYYYHNVLNLGGGGAAPVISSFTPASGSVGTEVTVTGSNFSGAIAFFFNGTQAATLVVDSDTQIRAIVPAGATTGRLRVATPSATGISATNFTVTLPNQAPTVNAGLDQTVALTGTAMLDGTVTDDGQPSPPATVTATWSKVSGPITGTVTFGNAAVVDTTATFSAPGVYVLRLTASDSALTAFDEVTISVNRAPSVNAGADQTITQASSATLDGTVTDDALPNPPATVTTTWSKANGPITGTVTFGNAAAIDTTASFSLPGIYVLRLTATDSALTTFDEVTISVNQPPNVNAGLEQTITAGTSAILDGTVTDDGLPNPPATVVTIWSKASGPVTGTVTFGNASAVDTTASFSEPGVYVLRLTANDSTLTTFDEVTISVNQPPSVNAGMDQTITVASNATLDGTVTDDGLPNPPASVATTWSKAGGPATGTVVFGNAAAVDTTATFSAPGVYVLRLTANDSTLTTFDEVTISVNQLPNVNAGVDQTITAGSSATLDGTVIDDGLPNPPAAVTTTWSKTSGPGAVTFGNPAAADTTASFSQPGVYVLRLIASDSVLTAFDEVSITVNQPPSVNAGVDQTITLPGSATLDGTGTDDGLPNPPATMTTTWSKTSGPGVVTFGNPAAADTTASFSLPGIYVLRLTINDSILTTFDEITITVVELVPTVQFSQASYSVNENGASAVVTVNLSTPSSSAVTVEYATSNGTGSNGATAGVDYTATSGTLTFNPGQTSQTFTVAIAEDVLDEPVETISLALGNPTNATLGTPANATLTIIDNDGAPTVQFGQATYSVNESGATATITVDLSNVASQAVTVEFATNNGTATAGSDYTTTSGLLTFPPGQTSQIFTVAVAEDALDESDETLNLVLSNATNAELGTPVNATLMLVDNDDTLTVRFSTAVFNVGESVGSASVTVALSTASNQIVTVNYATSNGTATAGNDYTAASGTLTFNPGQTSQSFTVPIIEDNEDEPDETINLALTNPQNAVLIAPSNAVITIRDNDSRPALEFSAATYTANEGDGAATISVILSAPSSTAVTVNYATSAGTATPGSDYTETSGTLTFTPGQLSQSFPVPILNDAVEDNNETINLALSNPSSNSQRGTRRNAELTIIDNESLPTVQFGGASYTVAEDGGVTTINVTLSAPSTKVVAVDYTTSNGTATAGADYTATSGTLTFNPGQTTQNFTVLVDEDALDETDETVILALGNAVNGAVGTTANLTLTIIDNDSPPTVQFSGTTYSMSENASSVTITLTLSAPSGQAISVDYTIGPESLDHRSSGSSGTLTLNPGETTKAFNIPVLPEDRVGAEDNLQLTLSHPVNATLTGTPSAVLTVVDTNPATPMTMIYLPVIQR